MTPMTLERAIEVALLCTGYWDWSEPPSGDLRVPHGEVKQSIAVLRAFMEKGLPFYRAAEAWAIHCGPLDDSDMTLSSKEFVNVIAAYREMKEGT